MRMPHVAVVRGENSPFRVARPAIVPRMPTMYLVSPNFTAEVSALPSLAR